MKLVCVKVFFVSTELEPSFDLKKTTPVPFLENLKIPALLF